MKKGLGGGGAVGVLLTSAIGHIGDKLTGQRQQKLKGHCMRLNLKKTLR